MSIDLKKLITLLGVINRYSKNNMEMKFMKKSTITLSLLLASSCLLMGIAGSIHTRPVGALEAADAFSIVTDLESEKQIHTERQAEYLAYSGDYVSIPEAKYPDGQQHLSDPEPVQLEWNFSVPSGKTLSRYDVVVGQEADLKDGYAFKGTTETKLDIYNSYLGVNYFKVVANYADGTKDESEIKSYKVEEVYPRNLRIEGMTNCRDMGGGRQLEDGGYIKQGLIYRTSSTNSWAYGRGAVPDTITTSGKEELFGHLGCKTEINVNNSGNKQDGVENFVEAYMWYDSGKHHLYRNAEPLKRVFHALANPDNYPIFYHCRIGTDRTGLCAIMISGLLGVPENLIYQDYLFSNFGNIQEKRYIGEKAGRDNILNYINDLKTYPGEKFQNKVYNFLLSIGVPAVELDSIINILTEGTQAKGNHNQQEVILADEFEAEGTEIKTIADTVTGKAAYAHPKNYYTLGTDQTVSVTFNPKYNGEAKLIAYLGSSDSSSSKKIADSIYATLDGGDVEIDDITFADVGFGSGDSRTYYSPVMLGTVDISAGATPVEITGIANNLNIGAIAIIPLTAQPEKESDEPAPAPASKGGCGGSIVATASLISLVGVSAISFLFLKRKED